MKKKSTFVKIMIVSLMCFTLIGCGSKDNTIKKSNKKPTVELETQVLNGIKMAIPNDMPSFTTEDDGSKLSRSKKKNAYIQVSDIMQSNGEKASDYTDQDMSMENLGIDAKDYKILDFSNSEKTNGVDTVYVKVSGKNKSGANLVMYTYIFIYEDNTEQAMIIMYAKNNNTSLEKNIDKIKDSITVTQKESTTLEPNTSIFKLKIDNTSQMEVYDIYCSDTSDWGNGFLNGNVLEPNLTSTITLSFGSSLVKDIKLEALQGAEVEFYDIDFTGCDKSGATMTITSNETDVLIELNGKTYTGVIV